MSTVSNTIQGYFSCFSKQLNCFYVLSTKKNIFQNLFNRITIHSVLNSNGYSKYNNFLIYSTISPQKFRFNNYFLFFASTNNFSLFIFLHTCFPSLISSRSPTFPQPNSHLLFGEGKASLGKSSLSHHFIETEPSTPPDSVPCQG